MVEKINLENNSSYEEFVQDDIYLYLKNRNFKQHINLK